MVLQENGETYLTVKEACKRLGISRQALYGYIRRGDVQKYERTLARRTYFKESEINALLEIRQTEQKSNDQ